MPSRSSLALLLLPLALLAVRARALPGPVGDWAWEAPPRDGAGAFGGGAVPFGDGTLPFGVAANLALCGNTSVTLEAPPPGGTAPPPDAGLALTAALAAAAAAGGGTVRLGAGAFELRSPVLLASRTCLVGAGSGLTVLRAGARFDRYYAGAGLVRARRAAQVTLANLTVRGLRARGRLGRLAYTRDGVVLDTVRQALVSGVRATGHAGAGFAVRGAGARWASRVVLDAPAAQDVGGAGVAVEQAQFVAVRGARVRDAGGDGIEVKRGAAGVLLYASSVAGAGGCGVAVAPGPGIARIGPVRPHLVRVRGGVFLNAAAAGICVDDVYDVEAFDTQVINLRNSTAACYRLRNGTFIGTGNTCAVLSGVRYAPKGTAHVALPIPQGPGRGCPAGIMHKEVCCPRSCGVCGGRGCGTRGRDGQCCVTKIRATNRNCASSSPPCVVS